MYEKIDGFFLRERMDIYRILVFCFASFSVLRGFCASEGDADPVYKACVEQCEKTACVGETCFQRCRFSSDGKSMDGPWYLQEPLYIQWKQWDCLSSCQYHCMLVREEDRQKLGERPVKYHGKWPIRRAYGIQEPVSWAFASLNLAVQFHGWVSFFIVVNYRLPLRPNRQTYYEYTGLWHFFGFLVMNFFFWSAVCHSWAADLTEKLDCSSCVAALGISLVVVLIRVFNVRTEAARVMVAAPLIAFVTTHVLFLNIYQFDYGWNMIVCVAIGLITLALLAVWSVVTKHPSRWKVWLVVIGGSSAILLQLYDFPPYWGFLDAHAICHAICIPLSCLWWSFIRDDSEYRTEALIKKAK